MLWIILGWCPVALWSKYAVSYLCPAKLCDLRSSSVTLSGGWETLYCNTGSSCLGSALLDPFYHVLSCIKWALGRWDQGILFHYSKGFPNALQTLLNWMSPACGETVSGRILWDVLLITESVCRHRASWWGKMSVICFSLLFSHKIGSGSGFPASLSIQTLKFTQTSICHCVRLPWCIVFRPW